MTAPSVAETYAMRDAGAAVLDQHVPNWPELIDKNRADFDMADPYHCTLAAVEPTLKDEAEAWLDGKPGLLTPFAVVSDYLSGLDACPREIWAWRHGFLAVSRIAHEMLTVAWLELVDERLAAKAQTPA